MHGDAQGAQPEDRRERRKDERPPSGTFTVRLSGEHRVDQLGSADAAVDEFLAKRALDWQSRGLCNVWVALNPGTNDVLAYYTLSSTSLVGKQISSTARDGAPVHLKFPLAQVGYMGRFNDDRLKGTGEALLYDAAQRAASSDTGAWGLYLEAAAPKLVAWYKSVGFEEVIPDPNRASPRARLYCRLPWLLGALDSRGNTAWLGS